jgi:hypothetical protein
VEYWRAFVRSYTAELGPSDVLCLSRLAWPLPADAPASSRLAELSVPAEVPRVARGGRSRGGWPNTAVACSLVVFDWHAGLIRR